MLLVLFILLLLAVLIGLPIILAIASVTFLGLSLSEGNQLVLFPQRIFASLDSFSLLALPYFILAGSLMSEGGLSKAIVEFSQSIVGRVRGSLAHTSVFACTAMANVSGSSAAEAAAIGSVTIPQMKNKGYKPELAAVIVATAATIGPVIPPSMTMIIYGSMAGVSIGGLFLAGILPGLTIALSLVGLILLLSLSDKHPELRLKDQWQGFKYVFEKLKDTWVALLAPVIILGGIFSGVFTATEAGIVACVYALIVGLFIRRTLKFRQIPDICIDAALTTTMVVGIIGVAGGFGWLLAYHDFNFIVLEFFQNNFSSPTIVLITLLLIMIGMTMFMESLAVLVILVPVISYVGATYGYDPLHLGVLVIIATQIGALTPPVAVLLFVTNSIADSNLARTFKMAIPFILWMVMLLLIFMFFPEISTWIPGKFMN